MYGLQGQLPSIGVVQAHMVAVEGVRAERHMVDSHQIPDILKMLHNGFHRVYRVVPRDGRVGGGLDPDDAALLGAGQQHFIRHQALAVP